MLLRGKFVNVGTPWFHTDVRREIARRIQSDHFFGSTAGGDDDIVCYAVANLLTLVSRGFTTSVRAERVPSNF